MLTDANEGCESPRGTAARIWGVSALFVMLVAVLPATIFVNASSWTLDRTAREILLPVDRANPTPPVQVAMATTRHDPDFKLEAKATLDLFHSRDYRIEGVRSGEKAVPRVVLTDLPTGMTALESPDDRKALFVKTLLPLILLTNERIMKDRERVLALHALKQMGEELAPQDRLWLADLAVQYGMVLTGEVNTKALLQRVDVVPASLALAQAAEESGWGTSRIAQKGNALFGEQTWKPEEAGIAPRNRRQGDTYRFRAFEDPKGSVESYIRNLNTHRAYAQFRQMRASLRAKDKPVEGLTLANALVSYSERGDDYVRTIRSLIRVNNLSDFDKAVLTDDQVEEVLGPQPGARMGTVVAQGSIPDRQEGIITASLRR